MGIVGVNMAILKDTEYCTTCEARTVHDVIVRGEYKDIIGCRYCIELGRCVVKERYKFKVVGKNEKNDPLLKCPECGNIDSKRMLNILKQCNLCKIDYTGF
jgi:hypothetical protein